MRHLGVSYFLMTMFLSTKREMDLRTSWSNGDMPSNLGDLDKADQILNTSSVASVVWKEVIEKSPWLQWFDLGSTSSSI